MKGSGQAGTKKILSPKLMVSFPHSLSQRNPQVTFHLV